MSNHKTITIITLNPDTFSNPMLLSFFQKCKDKHVRVNLHGMTQFFEKPQEFTNVFFTKINHKRPDFSFGDRLSLLNTIKIILSCLRSKSSAVIGVDPFGIVAAGPISRICGIPLVYFSFEIFFTDENNNPVFDKFKMMERAYSQKAQIVCIQDSRRKELLKRENNLTDNQTWHLIPVASLPLKHQLKPWDIRSKFNIQKDKTLIIYSGTIAEWSGLGYIISALERGISADYWIFIHSRYPLTAQHAPIAKLMALKAKGAPITLHDQYFQNEVEYFEFLAAFELGLAVYVTEPGPYTGKNIKNIGLSSGKFSAYTMLGIPSIVQRSDGYEALKKKYDFGFLISDAQDLSDLLSRKQKIPERSKVKEMYQKELNPDIPITNLIEAILAA